MFKLIVILAIAGTLALVGIQFVPVYIQNHAITKVAQDVVSQDDLRTKREVLKRVQELFNLNDISHDPKEIVTVERDNGGDWVVGVKYEERRKLMYNLELVAAFDDQITD